MEHPPLIDVEPEEEKQNARGGGLGCLGRALRFGTIGLALVFGLMWLAFFIWGGQRGQKVGDSAQVENVEAQEKGGVAGLLDKVKKAVQGEEAVTTEGEHLAQNVASEVAVTESQVSEEDSEEAEQTAGSSEEQAASPKEESRPSRGGSRGGSEAGVEVTSGQSRVYMKSRGNLSTSGSDLNYELIYQESGGQLHYRFFLLPYDSQVGRMFQADKGELTIVFANDKGERLLPTDGPLVLPLSGMTAFEARGQVAGWVSRGIVPLQGQDLSAVSSVKLGWDFDQSLGDLLKALGTN